jgi:hypothetical protein
MLLDNMRGWVSGQGDYPLYANLTNSEGASTSQTAGDPTATGFTTILNPSVTYIYIAIRRGPMKVPTTGTSVFSPIARTGDRLAGSLTGIGFSPDTLISLVKTGGYQHEWNNKLAGSNKYLRTTTVELEFASTDLKSYDQDGVSFSATDFNSIVNTTTPLIQYFLKRSPSVFDIVCTTGFVDGTLVTHNLGVTPELIFVKDRAGASNWMGAVNDAGNVRNISINTTSGGFLPSYVYSSYFTATTINPAGILNGGGGQTKGTGVNAAIYLFATLAGVSKVGSYTGTAATLQIDCGFTAGARFVLIKRTDSTGAWYVWDTARGIVSGNDPYLLLNSNAAEVTNTDYIDPYSAGFELSSTAPAALNASGGTYIFLAIA